MISQNMSRADIRWVLKIISLQKISEIRSVYIDPSNAETTFVHQAQGSKHFSKSSKPCHVGIHWIALAEYYLMSTMCQGFSNFF